MNKKLLPIGNSNFKSVIENNYYYVDKTDVIETLLSTGAYVSLFPRPRRFGKSLFMSMIGVLHRNMLISMYELMQSYLARL